VPICKAFSARTSPCFSIYIIRGIERRPIFRNDSDRADLLQRLGRLLSETQTECFAWALIPNHAHFLLLTGRVPIAALMRRVLKRYAVSFVLATTRKELAGPSKRLVIVRALSLVSHIATQDLSITGSDVARRLNVDRSTISQAAQRVSRDSDLIASTKTILSLLELETIQH